MFIGHFGLAMATKKWAPQTSLPVLILAAEFVDVLWPMALIAGVEHVRIEPGNTPVTPLNFYDYPWTHSLLMGCVWALVFAAMYFVLRKYKAGAIACAVLVVSHWVLDLVVHVPDLPLIPGNKAVYGLGLWHSRLATVAVEVPIFIVGVWIYTSVTRSRDRAGHWIFGAFVTFSLVMYELNIQGNPPPGVPVLEWSALAGTLILLMWAGWVERHRTSIRAGN